LMTFKSISRLKEGLPAVKKQKSISFFSFKPPLVMG
jgi:hypothetical protein